MEGEVTNRNGGSPAMEPGEEEARFQLQALIDVNRDRANALAAELDELEANLTRWQSALRVLDHEPAKARTKAKAPAPARKHRNVSDEKVDEVLAAVRRAFSGEGVGGVAQVTEGVKMTTATTLAGTLPGMSPDTVKGALEILREREVLRLAGKGRGGGSLYALMPGGDD